MPSRELVRRIRCRSQPDRGLDRRTEVDTGAVNRKLGSDMADSVTGGGLHGKDLSKADVSVNIYAWLKAQETGKPVEISCAIGDHRCHSIKTRREDQYQEYHY